MPKLISSLNGVSENPDIPSEAHLKGKTHPKNEHLEWIFGVIIVVLLIALAMLPSFEF